MIRIYLADWRDRKPVRQLRQQAAMTSPDGALYEWLTGPTYHVHLAVGEADYTPYGITACMLWPDGAADDLLTYVVPERRMQGLAHQLRAVQARDLLRMGWTRLYTTARMDDQAASACAVAQFGTALGTRPASAATPPMAYHGSTLAACMARLMQRGTPMPRNLSELNGQRLDHKAQAARTFLSHASDDGAWTLQKAHYRARPLETAHAEHR